MCRSNVEEGAFIIIASSLQRPRTKEVIVALLNVRRRAVWDAAACAHVTPYAGRPLTFKRLTYAWCDDQSRAHERAMQVLAGRQSYQTAVRILANTRLPELEHSPDWSSAQHWAAYFQRERMLGKRTFTHLSARMPCLNAAPRPTIDRDREAGYMHGQDRDGVGLTTYW